jgi:hypothetical protein
MKSINHILKNKSITIVEWLLIASFSIFPTFLNFPYRINIFLSWEGAYRLYLGEVPYRDFGLPMGFGYWLIPAAFFKIFGPYMLSLIKAQAFINILSALAFRSILKSLDVKPGIRMLSILLFLISFSFVNFWPWYNHTVIVYELIAIAFLMRYIFDHGRIKWLYLFLSTFFVFLSIFTKQDAGAFTLLTALALIGCHAIYEKKIWPALWFVVFLAVIAVCIVAPFIPYHIGYWFNYGQPPHSSRLSLYDILDIFFGKSDWIKFYLIVIALIWVFRFREFRKAFTDKKFILFSLLISAILFEASIFQVTSYIPEYNNIFFHSFAIAYIASTSGITEKIDFKKPFPLILTALLIMLWWSSRTWQYANRYIARLFPSVEKVDTSVVSIRTYLLNTNDKDTADAKNHDLSKWSFSPWRPFKGIYMPDATISGVKRLLNMPEVKNNGKKLRVLNMTELTPLAEIIKYPLEIGTDIPLWYHKDVAMFERQIQGYDKKIKEGYYDLVLYEYVPILNNFYPFEIQDSLNRYYRKVDSFPGPRRNDYSLIEVYTKKLNTDEENR